MNWCMHRIQQSVKTLIKIAVKLWCFTKKYQNGLNQGGKPADKVQKSVGGGEEKYLGHVTMIYAETMWCSRTVAGHSDSEVRLEMNLDVRFKDVILVLNSARC